MTTRTTTVPPDIWNLVLEQVFLMPWMRRVTLRNACLVNKQLSALATMWLYRHVKVSRNPAWRRCDAFYTIFEYRRDWARYVHVLVLDCPWGDEHYATQEPWVRNWLDALSICTELRDVEIRQSRGPCTTPRFNDTLGGLLQQLPALTRLRKLTLELQPPVIEPLVPLTMPPFLEQHSASIGVEVKVGQLRELSIGTLNHEVNSVLVGQLYNSLVAPAESLEFFNLTLTFTSSSLATLSSESRKILARATNLRIVPATIFPIEVLTLPIVLRELNLSYHWYMFADLRNIPSIPTLIYLAIDSGRPTGTDIITMTRAITSLTFQSQLKSLTIRCSTHHNNWSSRIEDVDFARTLPDTVEVFSCRVAMVLPVATALFENCWRLRALAVCMQRKDDVMLFLHTLRKLSRDRPAALECFQQWCWDYVSFSKLEALRCIMDTPKLRHVAVNSLGWLCPPRSTAATNSRAPLTLQPVVTFHETCALR